MINPTRILSIQEKPANIEKIFEEFKLKQRTSDEWVKDGLTIIGGVNNLSGEKKFTVRIKTSGIMPDEEKESIEIYERLKKEYANKILSSYII